MAKKDSSATATQDPATGNPPEGSGIAATAAPDGKDDAAKHDSIAAVMEAGLGRKVLTPGEAEAEEGQASTPQPDLGPHPTEGLAQDQEPEAEADQASPQTPVQSKPSLTRHQMNMAKELGLSDEEISSLEDLSPAELINALGKKFHAKASELGRLEKRLKTPGAEEQPPVDNLESSPENKNQSEDDLDFEYSEDDWRDNSEITKRNQHLVASKANTMAIGELQAKMDEFFVERRSEEADRFFEGLDSEAFSEIMGEGSFSALAENGPHAQARVKLLEEASNLQEYFKLQGKSLKLSECLGRALHFTYAEQIAKSQLQKKGKQVTKSRRRATTRPTEQRSSPIPATDESSKHSRIAQAGNAAGVPLQVSK